MSLLEYLRKLDEMRRISEGREHRFDISGLEALFLSFSQATQGKELIVKPPRLYNVEGEEETQMAAVLHALKKDAPIPKAIDISGGFDYTPADSMIIMSPQQIQADHVSEARSSLNPLIERVFIDGTAMIRDFTVHEALCGEVTYHRGDLLLKEIALFPERFVKGPYELRVILDTPNKTVARFREFSELMQALKKDPKKKILDPKALNDLTEKAVSLRKILGALSRYEVPSSQSFAALANSCMVRIGDKEESVCYFVYEPFQEWNGLVYFGKSPFETSAKKPIDLTVIDGREHQHTLATLVERDVFKPSVPILQRRIADIQALYDAACRQEKKSLADDFPTYERLLSALKRAEETLTPVENPTLMKEIVTRMPPELLEFMVCPASDDPVIHELFARLSWNTSLRTYRKTFMFINEFAEAPEERKRQMVRETASSMHFNYQQNNDVNVWLYNNYRELCEQEGISFKVVSA